MKKLISLLPAALILISTTVASATSVNLTFTMLTGLTGGSNAFTAVYRANLAESGLSSIQSITIKDNSFGLGGATGQFSGFDLDAILLSNIFTTTATGAHGLTGTPGLDYSGAIFSPGLQRTPVDPKLYGTGPTGSTVDNTVATLGLFDAESTILTPDGFLSMGDGGALSLNLASAISTSGLYLYLGEVGNNGELIAGNISISDQTVDPVPEPSTFVLLGAGLLGAGLIRRRVKK